MECELLLTQRELITAAKNTGKGDHDFGDFCADCLTSEGTD